MAPNLCFATTYDVAADFSATNNPNGVWSYGWSSTLTSVFNQYTDKYKPEGMGGIDVWGSGDRSYGPSVAYNGTGSAITIDEHNITWQIGQLSLGPGYNGQYSHARWTAPYAGTFDIATVFTLLDGDGGSTDVYVLHNGVSLFDGGLYGFGVPSSFSSFSTTVSVGIDDTIDFAVGYGGDGFWNDSTALSATIVPEPATLLLLGLGGLAVRRRRAGRN